MKFHPQKKLMSFFKGMGTPFFLLNLPKVASWAKKVTRVFFSEVSKVPNFLLGIDTVYMKPCGKQN